MTRDVQTLVSIFVPLVAVFLFLVWASRRAAKANMNNGELAPWAQKISLMQQFEPSERFYVHILYCNGKKSEAGGQWGMFLVRDGFLYFVPRGATEPAWMESCSNVRCRSRGLFEAMRGNVTVVTPDRSMGCVVSREKISRFIGNDLKTLREATYGVMFRRAICAQGGSPA